MCNATRVLRVRPEFAYFIPPFRTRQIFSILQICAVVMWQLLYYIITVPCDVSPFWPVLDSECAGEKETIQYRGGVITNTAGIPATVAPFFYFIRNRRRLSGRDIRPEDWEPWSVRTNYIDWGSRENNFALRGRPTPCLLCRDIIRFSRITRKLELNYRTTRVFETDTIVYYYYYNY